MGARTIVELGEKNNFKIWLYSGIAVIFLLIVGCGVALAQILGDENIVPGVSVNKTSIGGLTKQEAQKKLVSLFPEDYLKGKTLPIEVGGQRTEYLLSQSGIAYDLEGTVEKAARIGRTGNVFSQLGEKISTRFMGRSIPFELDIDEQQFAGSVERLTAVANIPVVENKFTLLSDSIEVENGHPGKIVNNKAAMEKIKYAVSHEDFGTLIVLVPEDKYPEPVSAEKLYEQFYSVCTNARYDVNDNTVTIISEIPGRDFDKEEVQRIIDAHKNPGEKYNIPIKTTAPEITAAQLKSLLFRDVLSSYTTRYNAGDVNRTINLNIAANKINGMVFAPQALVSYNAIVGKRDYESGYRDAKVFQNGEIVDGLAGGICQVSSTLYNAALYANLEIVSRRNHQFAVSYVPLGQDATVVYGSTDLVFRNSTDYPIKIISASSGGALTIKILGTNTNPGLSIEIQNKVIKTLPFTVRSVTDTTLPAGRTAIKQKGANGFVVDTYRIVKKGGEVIKTEYLSKSTYNPIEQIELVGTAIVQTPPPRVVIGAPGGQTEQPPAENPQENVPQESTPSEPQTPPQEQVPSQVQNLGSGGDGVQ